MKQVRTQYVNLFEDMDFTMRLLSGEFDSAISKGQMKIEQVSNNKRPAKAKQIIAVVKETIEEPVQKSTDIEKAIAVLDGSCTDMTEEDFTDEAWAEANEKYYSMDDMDYKEEVSPEGETVITMSGERLIDFLMDRADTVSTWDDEANVMSEEYIYEDDEVNVNEECDATILSFGKAFSCMSNKEAEEVAPTSDYTDYTKEELLFVKLLGIMDDLIDTAYEYLITSSDLPYRAFNLGKKYSLYNLLDNREIFGLGTAYVYPYYSDDKGWDEELGYELGFDVYGERRAPHEDLFNDIIDNDCYSASICKSILDTLISNFTFKEPSKWFGKDYETVLDYDRIVQLLIDKHIDLKYITYESIEDKVIA